MTLWVKNRPGCTWALREILDLPFRLIEEERDEFDVGFYPIVLRLPHAGIYQQDGPVVLTQPQKSPDAGLEGGGDVFRRDVVGLYGAAPEQVLFEQFSGLCEVEGARAEETEEGRGGDFVNIRGRELRAIGGQSRDHIGGSAVFRRRVVEVFFCGRSWVR